VLRSGWKGQAAWELTYRHIEAFIRERRRIHYILNEDSENFLLASG
jgi:hypothetical protein